LSKIKVAINGFGRIGRTLFRIIHANERFEVVCIRDLSDVKTMAHLLKYDSIHGQFPGNIEALDHAISVNGFQYPFVSLSNQKELDWSAFSVDVVVECTGSMKNASDLEWHIQHGAKKVLLSAPSSGSDVPMVVPGVNDNILIGNERYISCASCTTNSAAPMIQLLDELCGIESCYITTVHSYTGDQRLHDAPHNDLRRARAAAQSIVPTTTGAAKALSRIFPHLSDRMGGCGIRVPVADGSLTDITCMVRELPNVRIVNEYFAAAASGRMKGILQYTEDSIVSVDVINNAHSCLFDAQLTSVVGGMVKVVGWYDNEVGYSHRLVDLLLKMQS